MEDYRYNELLKNVSTSMMMKMKQIKRFVDGGKASVMVGAGFSKNAIMDDSTTMKNWDELAVDFYSRLYLKKPEGEDLSFKTPMRLASQIQTSFGRNELEKLIIDSLHDNCIAPSELHKSLLRIKWKDIFTTNYDTLLERTHPEVDRYEIITNKETLLYKKSPRIIKLHGSFPNVRPFIITEDDYRTYPIKYPEFVNTVRQSLIDGLLCLIGFSGDDPNFLNWLGWFRDIMGNQAAPVYMITYNKDFHISEVKLLNYRGIEPINFAEIKGISSIYEGLDFFLTYLEKKEKKSWNAKIEYFLKTEEDTQKTIEKMCLIRQTYPGWLALPTHYYTQFSDTDCYFPYLDRAITGLNKTNKLNFIYELDWRLSISLTPKDIKWYKNTLSKIIKDKEYLKDKNNIDKLNTLKISLLSIYRQNLEKENYAEIDKEIDKDINQLSHNLLRKYNYERCLYYVSLLNYKEAEKILLKWNVSLSDYIGVLWKSVILSDLGKSDEVLYLLNSAYQNIISALLMDTSPFLLSCSIAINNLINLYDHNSWYQRRDKIIDVDYNFYNIINFYRSIFQNDNTYNNFEVIHNFNIGQERKIWKQKEYGYIKRYLYSYQFVNLCERMGFPFGLHNLNINTDYQKIFLSNLIKYNINYTISVIIRSFNKEILTTCLTRYLIKQISREEVNAIFDNYNKECKDIEDMFDVPKIRFYKIILPLLSKLSVKLSYEKIIQLIKIYKYEFVNNANSYNENDLFILYECIDPKDMSSPILNEIYSTEIKLNYLEKDIALPEWGYKKYEPSNDVILTIIKGFNSTDEKIQNAAYIRATYIYNSIPIGEKSKIDVAIQNWRQNRTNVEEFLKESYTYDNSSVPIENLTSKLENILSNINYFNKDQFNKIIKKLTDVLNENQEKFKEDDSLLLFDGMRHLFNNLFILISQIIVKRDISKMDKEIISKFLDVILKYEGSGFHCLAIITKLWTKLRYTKQKDLKKADIEKKIDDNLFSESESNVNDAILAIHALVENGNNVDPLLLKMIDSIELSQNIFSRFFLNLLIDLHKGNKLTNNVLKRMPKLLERLCHKVGSYSMDEEYKTDIYFYANKLAGALSTIKGNEELSKAVNLWRNYSEDENTFNDVKVGFSLGEEMINDNE